MKTLRYKNLFIWLIVAIVMIVLFNSLNTNRYTIKKVSYTEFVELINENNVKSVEIKGTEVIGKFKNNESFKTYIPQNSDNTIEKLREKNINIEILPEGKNSFMLNMLFYWAPVILLVFLWFYFMNQMQRGGKAMSFGKINAPLTMTTGKKITFEDVAGAEESKEELREVIDFLKNPEKYKRLGAKIPRGVLLVGPPGTGKTLLAKAVAGEANVPFLNISGSYFLEIFVGVGASRVRDLFQQAKKNAPCIIFMDEIDAVGRHRGAGIGGGHDEREQTLNQLLVEMDGFKTTDNVIVMAATNRPDILDHALLRAGRFDRRIVVAKPDVKGREEILKVHTRNAKLAKDIDLKILAKATPGFSGADLANLVNEAVLCAARSNKKETDMVDFEVAKDKVLMGPERKSMIISEEDKKNTAYHESGHAIVAKLLPHTDPLHKVSIIPRGMAMGITQQLPEGDKYTYDKEYLLNTIAVLMGGRVAEELILKHVTTGAGDDIGKATDIAKKMVCEWGMSSLGPITYTSNKDEVFLGKEIGRYKTYSEETATAIDVEVKKIVNKGYETAKEIISTHINKLHEIARLLLEKETITGKDIDEILGIGDASQTGTLPA
ncbi:MAG: ATP-dependent zinc metalloprotease FtsH [Deltaproteobacteria bacterium]|nr:ATP-dependent zinc metalloprotease FtsH [Deltaproteobacteria bacterium]